MPTDPITITTTYDTPLFDPEDHRGPAAAQLGVAPTEIHCIAAGPDDFNVQQEAEYSSPVFSQDGTLLKPPELIKARIVKYERKTTWEPRPRAKAAAEPEPVVAPPLNHHIPTLSRGARWHGIKDGTEGNYISTGTDLVLIDSAEGLAVLSALHAEDVARDAATSSLPVG